MDVSTNIIKRISGLSEPFDERKLFTSVYAACCSANTLSGAAQDIANRICQDLAPWLQSKIEVTSTDIRHQTAKLLKLYHPDAAYLYLHHRIIE